MTNSKQGNVKEIFLFWKHTKRNEKINETTNRLYILISCSIWRDTVVQLINGLDFVFLCVAVWLCTIENQSLKQRKKHLNQGKNFHHNIYLRPFYRTLKAAKTVIQYTINHCFVFLFYEDHKIVH